MEGVLALFSCVLVIVLWVTAFNRLNRTFGTKGIRSFVWMFILMLFLCGILFLVIVVPTIGCTGWFCGLGAMIVFLAACSLLLLIFPILLLTVTYTLLAKRYPKKKPDDELID